MFFTLLLWLRAEKGEASGGAGEGGRQHSSWKIFEKKNHVWWGMWALRTRTIYWKNAFKNQRPGSGHISTSAHCLLLFLFYCLCCGDPKTSSYVGCKGGQVRSFRRRSDSCEECASPDFPKLGRNRSFSRRRLSAPWGQRRTSGQAWAATLCEGYCLWTKGIQRFLFIHNVTFTISPHFSFTCNLQKST